MSRMHWDWIDMRKEKRRFRIQILAALLTNGYLIGFFKGQLYRGRFKAICVPGLNCYSCPGALGSCPIGSLQAVLTSRDYKFTFYVSGFLMLFGILMGRLVCGFLCPFGLFQDLLYKIKSKKYFVPPRIDRPLRYLKYGILAVFVILLPLLFVDRFGMSLPYFCKWICPAGTLEGGIPLVLGNEPLRQMTGFLFQWKMLFLIAVIGGSVFIYRPFCKYICPLGAWYSLFQKNSIYQMSIEEDKCIGCKACERACQMQVKVTENINSTECIRCGKCSSVCKSGAVKSGFKRR